MADTSPQEFLWENLLGEDPTTYYIYVTSQTLPTLEEAWTNVELGTTTYAFRRSTNKSKVFTISGYIQSTDMNTTRTAAEGLNSDLLENPAGIFTDGYGTQYNCYVVSWTINPVAAINRYDFTMSLRVWEEGA